MAKTMRSKKNISKRKVKRTIKRTMKRGGAAECPPIDITEELKTRVRENPAKINEELAKIKPYNTYKYRKSKKSKDKSKDKSKEECDKNFVKAYESLYNLRFSIPEEGRNQNMQKKYFEYIQKMHNKNHNLYLIKKSSRYPVGTIVFTYKKNPIDFTKPSKEKVIGNSNSHKYDPYVEVKLLTIPKTKFKINKDHLVEIKNVNKDTFPKDNIKIEDSTYNSNDYYLIIQDNDYESKLLALKDDRYFTIKRLYISNLDNSITTFNKKIQKVIPNSHANGPLRKNNTIFQSGGSNNPESGGSNNPENVELLELPIEIYRNPREKYYDWFASSYDRDKGGFQLKQDEDPRNLTAKTSANLSYHFDAPPHLYNFFDY